VHWNDAALVDLLLKGKANVNAVDDHGVTSEARLRKRDRHRRETVGCRCRRQACEENGETALMTASLSGNVAIVKALLARRRRQRGDRRNGQTALMWATSRAPRDHAQLIAAKANVHAQSKIGFSRCSSPRGTATSRPPKC
jgi:ankyrin repeat protein